MEFWPGTNVVKSQNNGFTLGFSADWVDLIEYSRARQREAAKTQKRRDGGRDFSTIHGLSKMAKVAAPKRISDGKRGPEAGFGMLPDSKSGLLRAHLASGPKTGAELALCADTKVANITGLLKNDVRQGRVMKIVRPGCLLRYALVEAA